MLDPDWIKLFEIQNLSTEIGRKARYPTWHSPDVEKTIRCLNNDAVNARTTRFLVCCLPRLVYATSGNSPYDCYLKDGIHQTHRLESLAERAHALVSYGRFSYQHPTCCWVRLDQDLTLQCWYPSNTGNMQGGSTRGILVCELLVCEVAVLECKRYASAL